jgi:heavy metal sensor kinase
MTIRARLTLWYLAFLVLALLLILGWTSFEMFVEHRTPDTEALLRATGENAVEELGEVFLYGSLPALIVALIGGWFVMRRALSPVIRLTEAAERINLENLKERLPPTGSGDELDRLTEVFNAMMARLEDSFARIREFTLHASHELKTPLTVMRTEIEMALGGEHLTPGQRDLLANQLEEIQRLTKIVNSLTFLAKADAGQVSLNREAVRLDEVVKDSFADAQMLAGPSQIAVELTACEEVTMRGDRHRLRQLLLNLTDNAIKYNRPQGAVKIALHRSNGDAELVIANTGPGIPPEQLPRVFDRFYRGDPARSSGVEGCGLGLSISKWIVLSHGGSIGLASTPQDLTTVTVRLPL